MFPRLFHQRGARTPCLAHFFANGIIPALELVEHKSIEFCRVNLALFIQYGFFRKNADNFPYYMESVPFVFGFYHFAFQGKGKFFYNRRIDLFAFYGGWRADRRPHGYR